MTNNEQKDIVLENLRNGLSIEKACANARVAEKTYYNIAKRDPRFKKNALQARCYLATIASTALKRKIESGKSTIPDDITVLRIKDKEEWAMPEDKGGGRINVIIRESGWVSKTDKESKEQKVQSDRETSHKIDYATSTSDEKDQKARRGGG